MSQKDKYNNLVQSIKEDEEKEKEQNRFDATLEQIKEALTLLQKLLEAIKEAKESSETTQKGLNAAIKSADNAISGICSAIVKAEHTDATRQRHKIMGTFGIKKQLCSCILQAHCAHQR